DPPPHSAPQLGGEVAATDRGQAVLPDEGAGEQRPGGEGEQRIGESAATDVAVHAGTAREGAGILEHAAQLLLAQMMQQMVRDDEVEALPLLDQVPGRRPRSEERRVGTA